MKKIFLYIILIFLSLPIISFAQEDYLFDSFENSPNKSQIELIKDEKTRICEGIYLEAMYRRNFTRQEVRLCKNIFIKKIKQEIDYKRRVMGDRYIY